MNPQLRNEATKPRQAAGTANIALRGLLDSPVAEQAIDLEGVAVS